MKETTNESLVLSQQSSPAEIKDYFESVLELSKSDNEFPIDLDEVWHLAYARKDNAVRNLKDRFMQGADYQVLRRNAEQKGGCNKATYMLSVPCFEFFIARSNRNIFQVYCEVFHSTMTAAEIAGAQTIDQKMMFAANPEKVGNAVKQAMLPPSRPVSQQLIKATYTAIDCMKKLLHYNDASVARLINQANENLGLPIKADYANVKEATFSLKDLLAKAGSALHSKDVYPKLAAVGIVEQKMRSSSKGVSKFWSITEDGQKYGENLVSPHNPRETQPHFYESTFDELLTIISKTA